MTTAEQNRQELIDWLLAYAKRHKIIVEFVWVNPTYHPFSLKDHRVAFINMNWHRQEEVPFSIGHEIGHIMLASGEIALNRNQTFVEHNSEEDPADIFSVKLIYDYSCKMGDCFEDPGLFMQSYGIPSRVIDITKELFKANN